MEIQISVIVPIYNRAYCLGRCLDSIREQSFDDWECILIDDGSTDNSLALCREYEAKDKRFTVCHQANQGVSAARNRGLDMARGLYINFVDSDDQLDTDCLSELHKALGDTDWVIGGMQAFANGAFVRHYAYKDLILSPDPQHEKTFIEIEQTDLLYGPCCKLYRRSIIEDERIRFPLQVSYGEDRIFNFTYLKYVASFRILDKFLYYITVTPGSLSFLSIRSFDIINKIWKAHVEFYEARLLLSEYVTMYMKRYYCFMVWGHLATAMSLHDSLPVGKRYAFIRSSVAHMDASLIKGAPYSPWRHFVMRHAVLAWLHFELKYVLTQLSILR